MKFLIKILIVFWGINSSVFADQFSYDFFNANEGQVYIGVNTVTGTPCTIAFFNETMLYHYSKKIEKITGHEEALTHHMNSISSGHFSKRFFKSSMLHSGGGALSPLCLLLGRCGKYLLELDFKDQRPTTLSDYFNNSTNRNTPPKIQNRCQLAK